MRQLSSLIKETSVSDGNVAIFFLGQAGLVIKTSQGTLIAVDLYLSDCVEHFDGYKRLMPKLLDPNDLIFDFIVTTHRHYDHFDPDSVPILMSNDTSILLAARDCEYECRSLGISPERTYYLKHGDVYSKNDLVLHAVFCDHGPDTPDAIGLLLVIGEKKIYITGDTSLHLDYGIEIGKLGLDVMFVPINGAFGNLNESDAVSLCSVVNPKIIVPYHFWCFAEHGGNPYLFMRETERRLPNQKYVIMQMGECLVI